MNNIEELKLILETVDNVRGDASALAWGWLSLQALNSLVASATISGLALAIYKALKPLIVPEETTRLKRLRGLVVPPNQNHGDVIDSEYALIEEAVRKGVGK